MAHTKTVALLLALCLFALPLCACGRSAVSTLTVAFLKVGKADAIVLRAAGETLVLDTGEADDGEELASYLRGCGVETVDTLIITHFDKDHVGGAPTLLENFPVGRVLIPDYTGAGEAYAAFLAALAAAGIEPTRLSGTLRFTLGDADVLVDAPTVYASTAAEPDNDYSLITTVTHGENRLLFMGDAENERIAQWLADGNAAACALLKVPHHGVWCKQLPALLAAVTPAAAVICDSEKNPAEEKTLSALSAQDVPVYETKDGNITVLSDGATLNISL